jgi:hypothetical protein
VLTIFDRQIKALDARRAAERPARHAAWLRRELPRRTEPYDDAALRAKIEALCEAARELGFVTERDELRFIRLSFLPEAILADPRSAAVMARVLGDTDATPSGRLDFIERHIGAPLPGWPALEG